jgi:hypothetical protein
MRLSDIFRSHKKVKLVFIDFTLFKKGPYITVYPSGKTFTIPRFFNYFNDKEVKPERIEKNLVTEIYIRDTLL